MSDVLASSKQDMAPGPSGVSRNQALERLNRRMNSYRSLHEKQVPNYDKAMNSSNNQTFRETMLLQQRFLENNKSKKGSKKSEKQQSKMAGAVNKDSNSAAAASAAAAAASAGLNNKMNNSQMSMNGLPQYGGGGGIKRPLPEDDNKSLDNCVDPAKRLNLEPGIKCELSPPGASEGNFNNHDFGKYSASDSKGDIVGKVEPKDDVLNFKDDSLGDLDGIMNSDTFNDLMSDLNIPNDFIDQFEFNDKNALEDLGNVIGSEFGGAAGCLDDKDDAFLTHEADEDGASSHRPNHMSGSSSSFSNNDIQHQQQQQQQQGSQMNPMEASNAAERLKIMAQQHQQHQANPPVSCGGMGPSGMGPSRMGGPPMQGQPPHNMYHTNLQQQQQQQQQMQNSQQQQQQPHHQMGPNSMANGHMMQGNLPPGGMPMQQQQQQGIHPGMRPGGPPGSMPNLPTMPLPQSMPSSPMTSSSPMQQMPNMQHMQHGMPNGPMGHNPGMGPGMHPNMYNNSMMDPQTAMVRMRAQGRYRLGTPNPNAMPNNMRPGMQPGAGGPVMPGQNSPMGGGMPQPQVMSNQNMRQQVSTLKKFLLIFYTVRSSSNNI